MTQGAHAPRRQRHVNYSVACDFHGPFATVFRVAGAPFAPSEHGIEEVGIEAVDLGRFSLDLPQACAWLAAAL